MCLVHGPGVSWARRLSEHDVGAWPVLSLVGWALCLGAAGVVFRPGGSPRFRRQALVAVLALAAVFRIQAALDPPRLSSDLYRYLWDGRVQAAGVNPYVHPPAAEALAPLRDRTVHPRINRPEARTVYPPGAQAVFRGLHALGVRTPRSLRLTMGGIDMLAIALLALALRRRGQDPARCVLYAWAPLAVVEHAGNAHLEPLVVALIAAALLSHRGGRAAAAGVALGGATLIKLYPAFVALALVRRGDRRLPVALAATVGAGYLAYAGGAGARVLGFLPDYVRSPEDFNVGARRAFEWVLSPVTDTPRTAAFALCLLTLCGALAWIARRRRADDPEGCARALIGATLLLMPTAFHAWYATPLLALSCFGARASWLWLVGALPLSYLKYATPTDTMPAWVPRLEFLPTWALLGAEAARRRRERTP